MIKRIRIKNFQAHRSLTLDLDESITTIVGPSDAGKSAVLRALRWVCFNKPDGDGFITDGQQTAKVQVEFENDRIIRTRGKADNSYSLNRKKLVAFGRGGVPDLVSRVLNIDDTNFQLQHDAPFWFALSPGEVSRQINTIVDLGVIDSALASVQSQLRETAAQAKGAASTLACTKLEASALDFVPEMVQDYQRFEALEASVAEIGAKRERFATLLGRVDQLTRQQSIAAQAKQEASVLLKRSRQVQTVVRDQTALATLVSRVREALTIIDQGCPDMGAITVIADGWSTTSQNLNELGRLMQRITTTQDQLCQKQNELQNVATRLPSKCPTCGNLTA